MSDFIDPQDMMWLQKEIKNEDWENMDSQSLISKLIEYYQDSENELDTESARAENLSSRINNAMIELEGR